MLFKTNLIGMIVSELLNSKIEGNGDVGTLLFREYLTLPVYKYGYTALKRICFTAWVQIVSTSSYMWQIQTTSQNNISCWTYRWRILKILCFWVTPCTSAAVYEYDGQQMTSEAITVRPFILPFNLGPLSRSLEQFDRLESSISAPRSAPNPIFFTSNLATASGV